MAPRIEPHERPMNIGVFIPNWIGDVVMATPALRALRRRYPEARLLGIMRPYVAEVLAGTPWLDENIFYQPGAENPDLRSRALIARLRRERLDVVLLLTHSLRTALLAWASGARRRVGYVRNARGWLLTDRLYQPRERRRWIPTPVLNDYLRLTYAVGCLPESPRLELATTADDRRAAELAWQRLAIPPGAQVVVFNSGGAYGAAKHWPTEYFSELARRIVRDTPHYVLVLCGPNERSIAREIVRQADHPRVVSLADEPGSIGLSKACVERACLMVTTDSGPRHFAAAFDVPVVTLFGPTHIAWSENHYRHAVHLQRHVPCGPCQQRTCPLKHHRCMQELSVDEVYREVAALLSSPHRSHAA